MKERPILFSAPMVRALLDGRKTQTRRIARSRHFSAEFHARCPAVGVHQVLAEMFGTPHVKRPYGVPGDQLWVRETWQCFGAGSWDVIPPDPRPAICSLGYAATEDQRAEQHGEHWSGPWRPSIFMPRWASRITLELTEVRVQRLQEMSEADAIAEGIEESVPPDNRGEGLTPGALAMAAAIVVAEMPRATRRSFLSSALATSLGFVAGEKPWLVEPRPFKRAPLPRELFGIRWDVLNGHRAPWASNPWVWALSFTRVEAGA